MSASHDEEATARDSEVKELHPGKDRRHLRATLAGRVVLRDIERNEQEPEINLLTASYLTAVVADGEILFYAGSNPVHIAGTIKTSRVVDVEIGHEFDYTPPRLNPTLQLKLSEPGTDPLDLELESFTLDGSKLHQSSNIDEDATWWKAATAN